ncbi:SRPBCC family protein [Undibacter mobilis]|uniref:Carbon monoxide dehydrogenase n=1 Tax=Undibacter mobilis TaxID=2292256 RepID=A0A371B397_9BRAD|nr:SRPBCC family protein [Undibacter mobilis]RDV02048.1 carbon monoxide dehydrogenase [Undibacter mobilis]
MLIKNSFEIPLPPQQAWAVLMDIPRIAPCMPGAELTGQTPDGGYLGKVSVKLGPVALSFNGVAHFIERDETAKVAKVKAQGSDQKGRGDAHAVIEFRLSASGQGSHVDISTDVTLSGLVAQYGRGAGLIQAVATQLVGQFAVNLSSMITQPSAQAGAERGVEPAKPISGFSLVLSAIWQNIRSLWSR